MGLHARLSKLFNKMACQMTILTGFGNLHISLKYKNILPKKLSSSFCPTLSTIRILAKSDFRPLPSYFRYLWTRTLKCVIFAWSVANSYQAISCKQPYHSATLIDHIYTNSSISHITSGIATIDISDHLPVFCILKSQIKRANSRRYYRDLSNFYKENFIFDIS